MKPNRAAFEKDKAAQSTAQEQTKKEKPVADPIPGMYRVPGAGPFIYASNEPADGLAFIRPGHPVQRFHANGKQGAMMQARAHATKNIKENPLNWSKTLNP